MATKTEDKKAASTTTDTPEPVAATPAPAPTKRDPWAKFYQSHSPVMYSEMVERWGGERAMWYAYANGQMDRDEAAYFEGPRLFSSAKAFAQIVIPALKQLDDRVRAIEDMTGITKE